MKRTALRKKSKSETALIKDDIQAYLRAIVIKRDGGCIIEHFRRKTVEDCAEYRYEPTYPVCGVPPCNGYKKDGTLILQADHLITRANGATFADSRLVVCVCKGHHGWKSVGSNMRKAQYDAIVRQLLPADRVALWDRCEKESWRPTRTTLYDLKLQLAALKQELRMLELGNGRTHSTYEREANSLPH